MSTRDELIEKYIAELKSYVGATTDSELARLLSLDKRTVSAWRARKSIPQWVLDLLSGSNTTPGLALFRKMTPLDQQAFSLALFRHSRARAALVQSGSYPDIWEGFRTTAGFWALMVSARSDLARKLRDSADDPSTALALVLHDDIADADKTVLRDRETLEKIRPKPRGGDR